MQILVSMCPEQMKLLCRSCEIILAVQRVSQSNLRIVACTVMHIQHCLSEQVAVFRGRTCILKLECARAGCSRYNMTVQPQKTYRIRIINAGSLLFMTVCFAGHNVTIAAADAYPVNPLSVDCVDINLGQRCGCISFCGGWHQLQIYKYLEFELWVMCQLVRYLQQICMIPSAIVPASIHVSLSHPGPYKAM